MHLLVCLCYAEENNCAEDQLVLKQSSEIVSPCKRRCKRQPLTSELACSATNSPAKKQRTHNVDIPSATRATALPAETHMEIEGLTDPLSLLPLSQPATSGGVNNSTHEDMSLSQSATDTRYKKGRNAVSWRANLPKPSKRSTSSEQMLPAGEKRECLGEAHAKITTNKQVSHFSLHTLCDHHVALYYILRLPLLP